LADFTGIYVVTDALATAFDGATVFEPPADLFRRATTLPPDAAEFVRQSGVALAKAMRAADRRPVFQPDGMTPAAETPER
jgi:hypothetical protein